MNDNPAQVLAQIIGVALAAGTVNRDELRHACEDVILQTTVPQAKPDAAAAAEAAFAKPREQP